MTDSRVSGINQVRRLNLQSRRLSNQPDEPPGDQSDDESDDQPDDPPNDPMPAPNQFTNSEKINMFKIYILSGENSAKATREYLRKYPDRAQPHRTYFLKLNNNLKEFGSFIKKRKPRRRAATNDDNAVNMIAALEPTTSLRTLERQGIASYSSARRILKKHHYHPYKVRNVKTFHNGDNDRRLTYVRRMIHDRINLLQILWTDESTFTNQGAPNHQNTRYWSDTNPHQTVQTRPQIRYSVNVWCGMIYDRLIGPIFIDGLLRARNYKSLLDDVKQRLNDLPFHINDNAVIFQQDSAPAHSNAEVM